MSSKYKGKYTPEKWTVEGYRRFRHLRHQHYQLDALWPEHLTDEEAPEEYCELVDLEQFFMPIDNTQMLFDVIDRMKAIAPAGR